MINLEAHRLALAIAKKTLDENHFTTAQKTMDRQPPSSRLVTGYILKNKQPRKWDLKQRLGYRIVQIECNRHFLHIENQATGKSMILQHEGCSTWASCRILEYRYTIWQSWKICQPSCKFTYYISSWFNDNHSLHTDHCEQFSTHPTYSILYMITLINTSFTREYGELVLFQPVLKAYPTCHSGLMTEHIS